MDTDQLPAFQALVRKVHAQPGLLVAHQAMLENVVMEERVSPDRHAAFAVALGTESWPDVAAFAMAHKNRYLRERIDLDQGDAGVPDTFEASLNGGNSWHGIEDNLALYRVEDVGFALRGSGVDEAEFERAVLHRHQATANAAQRDTADDVLARVCEGWNLGRHQRPAFATTEPEIEDLLADAGANWPHALRDHLGLGHLSPVGGREPIKVLLMRYTVKEVNDQAKRAGHGGFCIPTVLDGPLNPYFFPTPEAATAAPSAPQRCGRALNLRSASTQADYRMGMELVHSYVNYRPEHVVRWGLISEPLAVDLLLLRRLHLDWLRLDTERDEFGCNLAHV